MTSMLAAATALEARKLRHRRSVQLLTAVPIALSAATAGFMAWVVTAMLADGFHLAAAEVFTFTVAKVSLAPAAAALLGALVGGGEHRAGVLSTTLIRLPRRLTVLLAKAAVVTVLSVVLALCGLLVAGLVSAAVVGPQYSAAADPGAASRSALGHVAVTVFWGLLACALAVLARSPVAAVAVVLGGAYVLEPAAVMVLYGFQQEWATWVAAHLPFSAAASLQNQYGSSAAGMLVQRSPVFSPVAAAAVLAALLGGAATAACRRFSRQDVRG